MQWCALAAMDRDQDQMTEDERIPVHLAPTGKVAMARPGSKLMAVARRAGLPVPTTCGGKGNCSHCLLEVREGAEYMSAAGQSELDYRPIHGQPAHFRMSCQTRVLGPCVVTHDSWK